MKKYYISQWKKDEKFFNINNIKARFISEKNYDKDMDQIVHPYLQERIKRGYINGKKNLKIYYEYFKNESSNGNIVISHGFGESTEKYYEFIYYLLQNKYNVFILEHRGNSRSQRLGIDNSQINVEKFEYYIEDLKTFMDDIVTRNSDEKPCMLFAHSMGGAIGTMFLEEYPEYFNSAVLSSPMHKINTGKIPSIVAYIVVKILMIFGKSKSYLPTEKPYKEKFKLRATNCRARYSYYRDKIIKNKLYQHGGASVNWYNESLKATKYILNKKNASKVTIPLLLLQAENDTYVIEEAHYKFAEYAQNCEVAHIKESKHESYYERDEITFTIIEKIISFYNENLKSMNLYN